MQNYKWWSLPCQWASVVRPEGEADTDARREVPGLAVDHVEALVTMGREPWVIISENVANILEKAEWTEAAGRLTKPTLGYVKCERVLSSKYTGTAQDRRRAYSIFYKADGLQLPGDM